MSAAEVYAAMMNFQLMARHFGHQQMLAIERWRLEGILTSGGDALGVTRHLGSALNLLPREGPAVDGALQSLE